MGGAVSSVTKAITDIVKPVIKVVDKVVDAVPLVNKVVDIVPDKQSSPAPVALPKTAAPQAQEQASNRAQSQASLLTNANPILGGGDRGGSGTLLTGAGMDPTKTMIGKDKFLG